MGGIFMFFPQTKWHLTIQKEKNHKIHSPDQVFLIEANISLTIINWQIKLYSVHMNRQIQCFDLLQQTQPKCAMTSKRFECSTKTDKQNAVTMACRLHGSCNFLCLCQSNWYLCWCVLHIQPKYLSITIQRNV